MNSYIMKEKLLTLLLIFGMMTGTQEIRSEESDRLLTENLRMRFGFENVSGTSVKDDVSGVTASLKGTARVVEVGAYHVLDLGNATGYLDMTRNAGTIVRELKDFTVSVCYLALRRRLFPVVFFAVCSQHSRCFTLYRLSPERATHGHFNGWLQP